MDTLAAKHFQEMDKAVSDLQAIEASSEQAEACSDRIQRAWADLRTDYSNLCQQVGYVAFTHPHLGDFSNWVQVEYREEREE